MQLPSLFDQSRVRPLTKEESAMLVGTLIAEKMTPIPVPPFETDPNCPMGFRLMKARVDQTGVPYSEWMVLFLASLCDTPGKCVMWAHSLVTKTREHGKAITVLDFGELSPEGVPTEEAYLHFWQTQKQAGAPLSNYLDTVEAWSANNGSGS